MKGSNDNVGRPDGVFGASPVVFVPAMAILAGYGLVLAALLLAGRGQGGLARLCMMVIGLGGPFLVAHAVLRFVTVRVDARPWALVVHPGFPRSRALEVPYGLIERAEVRKGPIGRMGGAGTLVLNLVRGRCISVADVARVDEVADIVAGRVAALREPVAQHGSERAVQALG